jgi:hypothetical protein
MSSAPVNTSSDLNAIAIQNLIKLIKEDTVLNDKWKSAALQLIGESVVPSSVAELENELKDVDD